MKNKLTRLCFFLWIFAMDLNGEAASETKSIASPTVSLQLYRFGGAADDKSSASISSPWQSLITHTGYNLAVNCLVIHTKDNPCSWGASYPHILHMATETKLIKKE